MNADERREWMNEITGKVLGCAFHVANTLGCGFLEKVYENALAHAIRKGGLCVEQQVDLNITYDGVVVGEYTADLLVEKCVLVETKAVKDLDSVHEAQCMNYLRGSELNLCRLINFGKPKLQYRRIVHNF